jgi:hypothetical protein
VKTLADAVTRARAGDRIVLDAGVYTDDAAVIMIPLTIEGAGGVATLEATRNIRNGKGILVVNNDVTLRNLKFTGARTASANGAGIRHERGQLLIEDCVFENNQNGILAAPEPNATLTIERSRFYANGNGRGLTHAIYANAIAHLYVHDTTIGGGRAGHDIKSRAYRTTVVNATLDDGVDGTPSYAIDIPNGGIAVVDGVLINQGRNTTNATLVAYGAEGNLHAASSLTVRNARLTSAGVSNAVGVWNHTTAVPVTIADTTFTGVQTPLRGPGTIATTTTASAAAP